MLLHKAFLGQAKDCRDRRWFAPSWVRWLALGHVKSLTVHIPSYFFTITFGNNHASWRKQVINQDIYSDLVKGQFYYIINHNTVCLSSSFSYWLWYKELFFPTRQILKIRPHLRDCLDKPLDCTRYQRNYWIDVEFRHRTTCHGNTTWNR